LNYLQELGVKVLWLSAIQETNTYGYDVTNFIKTKDEFGHLDKFKALLNSTAFMGQYHTNFFKKLRCNWS